MIRIWRIPFSTNVERVALAAAHKGIEVEWVDVPPNDRAAVVALSGQPLVPMLEEGGTVITDSTRILEHLETSVPEPPLYPREQARRTEARLLIDWFDRVWKGPPNELEDVLAAPARDHGRAAVLAGELRSSLDLFEALLANREFMLGAEFGAVDCAFFPFLKYGLLRDDDDDDEPFHRILAEHLELGGRFPRLEAWIRRVDARPRA